MVTEEITARVEWLIAGARWRLDEAVLILEKDRNVEEMLHG